MLLESTDIFALIIAMSTSIILIVLSIKQNAALTRDNLNLRRALRAAKAANHSNYYYDPDLAKEDLWENK